MEGTQPTDVPEAGAGAPAQPVEDTQVPAGSPQEPAQEAPQAPSDDDTAAWLAKKGFDLANPESVAKLASSYRESEKLALQKAQEAAELRKSLTPQEPLAPQPGVDPAVAALGEFAQEYKRDKHINAFKDAHPDWSQHEPTMVEMLNESVATPYGEYSRSQLVNMGILSLNDIYTMAKGAAPVDTESIKAQTKTEVLQTLATTQRAGGATPHAIETNPKAPVNDPILEGIRQSRGQ